MGIGGGVGKGGCAASDTTHTYTPSSPPIKARDFCTLVHYRRLRDGALVVVNRAAEHVKAPRSDK